MEVRPTALPDVRLISLDVHRDSRGHLVEMFNAQRFASEGLPTEFCQHNKSRSVRNVLRGLHFQSQQPQGKLVSCTRGRVFDIAVDIRVGSPTFRHWVGVELDEELPQLLWVPEGFAHGFCVLTELAELEYKVTAPYAPADQLGILWSDPSIGIQWPISSPVLSERDRSLPEMPSITGLPRYKHPTGTGAST